MFPPAMRRLPPALLLLMALMAVAPAEAAVPPKKWKPDVDAAVKYARERRGNISFAVRFPAGRLYGYRTQRTAPSASVLKAMLMVSYLNLRGVRSRKLRRSDLELLTPMIRWSDNRTAYRIRVLVGAGRLNRLARKVRMRRFWPAPAGSWGLSRITAADQTRFFLELERFIVPRHRATALRLLRTITRSQRWGIGQVIPKGWTAYFKGGWGSGTGAIDNQVVLLTRGNQRISAAVLTTADGSHAYGKATLRGVFKRLLRGLARSR
jgi:beta-lactamase class A